jgi:ankyrin repeat protein
MFIGKLEEAAMKRNNLWVRPIVILVLMIILMSCSSSAKNAWEARSRLAKMGVELSEQSFFSHVVRNKTEVVNLFIKGGMDPNVAMDDKTALLEACRRGYSGVGLALVEAGADVNAKDSYGVSCLMYSAITGSNKLILGLMDKGADVNARDRYGRSALIEALTTENDIPLNTYKSLIDAGADVNIRIAGGLTPIMLAADGNAQVLRFLIDAGADLNATDDDGIPVVERAKTDPQNYEILIAAGAKE